MMLLAASERGKKQQTNRATTQIDRGRAREIKIRVSLWESRLVSKKSERLGTWPIFTALGSHAMTKCPTRSPLLVYVLCGAHHTNIEYTTRCRLQLTTVAALSAKAATLTSTPMALPATTPTSQWDTLLI